LFVMTVYFILGFGNTPEQGKKKTPVGGGCGSLGVCSLHLRAVCSLQNGDRQNLVVKILRPDCPKKFIFFVSSIVSSVAI
jgi:hypothetical protein